MESVPAGEGDLAVAAKFALESIEVADSAAGLERRHQRKKGSPRSDSSDAGSSSDDDDSDDDDAPDDAPNARPSTEGAEYEFSDGDLLLWVSRDGRFAALEGAAESYSNCLVIALGRGDDAS